MAGEEMGIATLVIGVMFWLVYVGFKIDTRNEEDELLPIQSMVSMIMFATAGFLAFFSIELALGIALEKTLGDLIIEPLQGMFNFTTTVTIVLLAIIILGLLITSGKWILNMIEENVLK